MAGFLNVTNEWPHYILSKIFQNISKTISNIAQNIKSTKLKNIARMKN